MNHSLFISQFKLSLSELVKSRILHVGMGLSIAGIVGGLLGYFYQVLIGRLLTPAEYALFTAVMALTMFTSSPLGAVNMLLARRVVSFRANNQLVLLPLLYWRASKWLALVGISFLFLSLAFTTEIQSHLQSPTPGPIWIFGLLVALSALAVVNGAFFQGIQAFGLLAGTSLAGVFCKIVFSSMLIVLGLGVVGALNGVLLSVFLVWLFGLLAITQRFHAQGSGGQLPVAPFPSGTIVPLLIANVSFVAMTQLDMVLVNYYFPSEQAGLYAAASVLGKAVLYLPGGLVIALFPMVAENHAKGHPSAHILIQVVGVTACLCGFVALMYWWLGPWLITLLYGQAYVGAGELLRWYGLAILPMTLVMVAEHFLIAKGRFLFVWLFLGIAPIQLLAIHIWHEQLLQVIATIGLCGTGLMIVGYCMLWRESRLAG
jgi:O-antigen/teichoic acid export membrane protein